jgi:hypothetical protein
MPKITGQRVGQIVGVAILIAGMRPAPPGVGQPVKPRPRSGRPGLRYHGVEEEWLHLDELDV